MRFRKIYGESKTDVCPFCGERAITSNHQGVPVCMAHKQEELSNLKCVCGSWLDLKIGKYGPFFTCLNCGIVSYKKGLSINGYPLRSIDSL